MIDGRHTGTGGGNHIFVGGPTPADSPLLRNPGLLRSLIGYWHNHPALSYLFSGLFVGPTSQAPRMDEARNDQVYELEIAFKQIPESGPSCPGLVDRIFRNLLVDATGNTHRAEFCIDKLYSPETASGRLGLLEMRAFEMPPHSRMSLTQHLLLRSLIARFWKQPYRRGPGSLAHGNSRSLHAAALCAAGSGGRRRAKSTRPAIAFDSEWFAPHFEFRFPLYGTIEHRGIRAGTAAGHRAWHVLGEEAERGRHGALRRFVASSGCRCW